MIPEIAAFVAFLATARAQSACDLTTETHPPLTWESCTSSGCTAQDGQIVIDSNWRWTHSVSGTTNCYTGNTWDATLCPDDVTCAANCCLDGANYESTYGITTSGDALTLDFVTGSNVGSRTYLMGSETAYQEFTLLGNEFTFDVDVSALGCGLNGALYFVSMAADGGTSEYPTNTAGAKYGTGYCDSQCPRDLKYIDGEANVEGWVSSTDNANTGTGNHGSCCSEMDIWEANSISTAFTAHPCETVGQLMCDGDACGGTYSASRYGSDCDPDGCDWNSYRLGNTTFYGPGSSFTINTDEPFTVVTQFPESGGSLSAINRFYIQNGVTFANPNADNIPGFSGDAITSAYCSAEATTFNDTSFESKGGLAQMSEALAGGMVLVMSLWDDYADDMLWLDSTYPIGSTAPGSARGTCSTSSGVPASVEAQQASANVVYSNIRFGPIGSTTGKTAPAPPNGGSTTTSATKASTTSTKAATTSTKAATTTTAKPKTSTSSASSSGASHYAQCGGTGWTGATTCMSPYTCTVLNAYYSQCL